MEKLRFTDKFEEKDISWKVLQNSWTEGKAYALMTPFVNASAIQERLDEVLGWENWKTEYEVKESGNYKYVVCILSCRTKDGEWISKQNVCEITEKKENNNAPDNPIKSAYSGAFKRVALEFGIGRYLKNIKKYSPQCSESFPKGENAVRCYDKQSGKTFYATIPTLEEDTPQPKKEVDKPQAIEKEEEKPIVKPIVVHNTPIGVTKAKEIEEFLLIKYGDKVTKDKIDSILQHFNCNTLSLITHRDLAELKKCKFDLEQLKKIA